MSSTWAFARYWAARGFHVFPLGRFDAPNDKHKIPIVSPWQEAATSDVDQVDAWAEQYPDHNYGVACGPSDLTVIDIDVDTAAGKDGLARFTQMLDMVGALPDLNNTYKVRTPRGGYHLYFKGALERPRSMMQSMDKMVDIKTTGGYVVGQGSRSPDGAVYTPENPGVKRPTRFPAELVPLCAHPAPSEPAKKADTDTERKTIDAKEFSAVLSHIDPANYYGDGGNGWFDVMAIAAITDVLENGEPCHSTKLDILWEWSQGNLNPDHEVSGDNLCSYDEMVDKVENAVAQDPTPGCKTIGSLVHEAQGKGYRPAPTANPDVFKDLGAPPPGELTEEFMPQTADAWESRCIEDGQWGKLENRMEWLADGLIEARGLHILSGGYGTMKTFLMLTTVLDMCQGRSTFERREDGEEDDGVQVETYHKVQAPVPTIYVAGEGASGYENRVKAYKMARGIPLDQKIPNFYFLDTMPLLSDDANWKSFVEFVARKGVKLAVFDTKTWLMVMMDQNSTRDAGFVIHRLRELRNEGVAIVLVDHTGKDFERGTKGAVDIPGAAELELIMKGKPKNGVLKAMMRKSKNGPEWGEFDMAFNVSSHVVDPDGPVPECVALTFAGRVLRGNSKTDLTKLNEPKELPQQHQRDIELRQVFYNTVRKLAQYAVEDPDVPNPNQHMPASDLKRFLEDATVQEWARETLVLTDPTGVMNGPEDLITRVRDINRGGSGRDLLKTVAGEHLQPPQSGSTAWRLKVWDDP